MSRIEIKKKDNGTRRWEVGDWVQLSESSEFNNGRKANPLNTKGVVLNHDTSHDVVVDWGNGNTNSYYNKCLLPWVEDTPNEEESSVSTISPWFGFKYKVNPETSRLLQEEVFKAGGRWWPCNRNHTLYADKPYMYVSVKGEMTYTDMDDHRDYFDLHGQPEKKIDIDPISGKLVEVDDKGHIIRSGGKGTGMYFDMSELVVPMTTEEYEEKHKGFKWPVSDGLSKDFLTKEEKETMSSNRREVKISLFDDDKGLEVEDSKVGSWKILTEDDSDTAIRELLMTSNVKGALDKHNEKRITTVDKEVLHRTGQEVKLQPVKLKNLRWSVSEL